MGVVQVGTRDRLHQLALDLLDGGAPGQPKPVRHPEDMRVDGDRRLAEGGVEHDVGRLAPDAGQRFERLAIGRHLAAVLLDQDPAGLDQVLCLVAVEAERADGFAQLVEAEVERCACGRVGLGEQAPRRQR